MTCLFGWGGGKKTPLFFKSVGVKEAQVWKPWDRNVREAENTVSKSHNFLPIFPAG